MNVRNKKILGIVVLGLLWCNVGFAEIKLLEEKIIKGKKTNYLMSTFCIDGYKYAMSKSSRSESRSLVQFYEERDGKSLPAKCQ